ncbi:MAG: phosphate acyltransferase PlsX [Euzebya sp.]
MGTLLPVVVDAMGGDGAPAAPVAAVQALHAQGVPVRLCGSAQIVGDHGVQASDWVRMEEGPAFAVRSMPNCSVRVAAREVAQGRAAAMVSAGPSGATVAAAVLELGRLPGARRAAIAARIPVIGGGHTVLLDVGAAVDVDAETLVSHARLGVDYARRLGVHRPRIGLLNMGTEPGKGNALTREAARLLGSLDGFIGNVEPEGLRKGVADVVVTDGFSGNLVLKALEAASPSGHGVDQAGLVLGVRGTVLVAHGAATAAELATAIRLAVSLGTGFPDYSIAADPRTTA